MAEMICCVESDELGGYALPDVSVLSKQSGPSDARLHGLGRSIPPVIMLMDFMLSWV